MSLSRLSPDDPKLTAYALGELAGEDRAAVEAALRADPALQAAVDEIRAAVAQIETALAAEPVERPAAPPMDPYARKPGKLIRFPQIYYVVGGLAAACFALVVALRPVREAREKKSYAVLELSAPAAPKIALPAPEEDEKAKNAIVRSEPASPAALPAEEISRAQSNSKKREASASLGAADQLAQVPAATKQQEFAGMASNAPAETILASPPAAPVLTGGAGGKLAENEEVVALSPFQVRSDKDGSYLKANSSTATRIGMEIQRVPLAGGIAARSRLLKEKSDDAQRFRESNSVAGQALPAMNTESYAYRNDNAFLAATENPLSTFSVDVDTASYSNLRRFLQGGSLPPADAVRIEELVNYFPYAYSAPTGREPFAASMEVAEAPWAPSHRLVRIGLKGREVGRATRPAANLVFLLDVSGSMDQPNKLPLVKESMRLLVSKLRPDDRVAIVVYAGASGLALPSTPVAKAPQIIAALDSLSPGGSTNGAMGIQLAYDVAKANFVAGGVNRVILCTDGDFNVGVTSEGDLTRLIEEKAKSGVFLTALGFGMGNYKDATLEQLADKGNGNYGYIDTRREAEKLLVEQVNGTLVTIAKDVKLQVEFNPALVASYRLIGYENRLLKKEDFNNDKVDAGEIGAGHTVTALYEIVPVGAEETAGPAVDPLKYAAKKRDASAWATARSGELLTLKVRYKEPAGEVSQKLEFPLVDSGQGFGTASGDFKFAAAVAEFGMILRESPYKGAGTLGEVVAWAEAGLGSDAGGYRGEFVELVKQAAGLAR